MPTGNYYDIVTLLDLIDNNGNISLTVDLLNINALVTINLVEKQIYAKSSDLELNFDLTEKVIYVRYPGVLAKLSLNDIDYVVNEIKPIIAKFVDVSALDKINFNSLNEISIEEILSAITVVDNQNELSISIALGDAIINALISTKNKEMNLSFAKVTLGETEITASPVDNALALNFDKSLDYIDLKELVAQFAPAVRSVVTEENLYAEMTATIVLGNLTLEIVECKIKIADVNTAPKANVFVSVKVTETKDDGSKKESTHDITLVYLDPSLVAEGAINTYFTYDDKSNSNVLEGTFTTVKFYDTIEILKQTYVNIPELSEALKPFLIPDENGMPTLPQIDIAINELINVIFFENGTLAADINGTAINENLSNSALINLSTDNDKLVLAISKLTFGDISLSLNGKVGKADLEIFSENDFVINPSANASDFSSINELLLCLQNTAKERHFYIDGKINLTGILDLTDKVDIDVYIDVIDGKTYVNIDATMSGVGSSSCCTELDKKYWAKLSRKLSFRIIVK